MTGREGEVRGTQGSPRRGPAPAHLTLTSRSRNRPSRATCLCGAGSQGGLSRAAHLHAQPGALPTGPPQPPTRLQLLRQVVSGMWLSSVVAASASWWPRAVPRTHRLHFCQRWRPAWCLDHLDSRGAETDTCLGRSGSRHGEWTVRWCHLSGASSLPRLLPQAPRFCGNSVLLRVVVLRGSKPSPLLYSLCPCCPTWCPFVHARVRGM